MADGYWDWTGAEPSVFESAPQTYRYFCKTCGTTVAYRADKFPGEIHFYISALDSQIGFEPTGHVHATERVVWCDVKGDLPRWAGILGKTRLPD